MSKHMDESATLIDMAAEVLELMDHQKQINENLKELRKSLKQKSAKLVDEMQRVEADEVRCADGRTMRLNTERKVVLD